MPAARTYDVVVFGSDVGGVAAAALSAKRGLRTLLVPFGSVAAARESDGWLLPAAHPMIAPLRQLNAASAALDDLGLSADLQRQAAPTQGAFQILGEKIRLSLPADPMRRKTELRRELSTAQAEEAERALETLESLGRPWDPFLIEPPPWPPRGFFERRRVQKIAPTPPVLPEGLVGDSLHALAPFAASLVGDSAPEATAREAAALFRAPLRLWGGPAQLAEILRDKMEAAGGAVSEESVGSLRVERKAVLFQLGGLEMRSGCVVFACGRDDLVRMLDGGGRIENKLLEESALDVGRKLSLAHFVVSAEGLPLALEEAALLLGHSAGPHVISALPARKSKGVEGGEKILTVARVTEVSFADGQALLESVKNALEPVLPFFERHVLHAFADLSPAQGHPILKPHEDAEPIGLRPISEASDRVMFASASTYPGFGLEGQFMAARAAAIQAYALSGRKSVSAT
jgi:phytoene dehydrogenase-like protein